MLGQVLGQQAWESSRIVGVVADLQSCSQAVKTCNLQCVLSR